MIASALVLGINAIYTWQRRRAKGALALFWLMLASMVWALGYGIMWMATTPQAQWFWIKVMYVGTIFVPTLSLIVVLEFTNLQRWLTRPTLLLLLIWPLLSLIIVWTNDVHHLFFSSFAWITSGFYVYLVWERGVWFWLTFVYSFLTFMFSVAVMISGFHESSHFFRKRNLILIVAFLVAWITDLFTQIGLPRQANLDLTPIGIALAGVIYAYTLFKYSLFDLNSIARRELLEHLQDAFVVLDRRGRIVDMNLAAQRLLGVLPKQAIGKAAAETLTLIPLPELSAEPQASERELCIQEGMRKTWYEVRQRPLRDNQLQCVGRVLIIRDITERKQAQEALRQSSEQLTTKNTEMDAFAHTVAHDLKNPVAVIIGYAEFLLNAPQTTPPETTTQALRYIFQTGQKLDAIIEELMLLAGVRKQEVLSEAVDMGHVVQNAIERLRVLIDDRQADIVLLNEATWPTALGYAPWIEEIWTNYLSNAIKYGGQPLHIEVSASAQPNGQARFWVRDNGPGLSAEAQKNLFVPFTRLDQVRAQGYGLGLSIVRRIVEKQGGQVGVESECGKGALFFFTLPMSTAPTGSNGNHDDDHLPARS